jgi:hypothetical protein
MRVRTRPSARWVVLCLLWAGPETFAQVAVPPPSGYVHLSDAAAPINPAHALVSRYIHAQGASALDDLFRKLRSLKPDPQSLEAFLKENKAALGLLAQLIRDKKLDIDENNPALKQLRQLLSAQKELPPAFQQLPPELKQFLLGAAEPAPAGPGGPASPAGTTSEQQQAAENTQTASMPEAELVEQQRQSIIGEWLYRQAERWATQNGGILSQSLHFQAALDRLRQFHNYSPPAPGSASQPFGGELSKWLTAAFPKDVFANFKLPDFPFFGGTLTVPDVRLPSPSVPAANIETMPPMGGTPEISRSAALGLAAIALVAFLTWRILSHLGAAKHDEWKAGKGGHAGWRLGPWPVQPQSIKSRDDVVRAFEYLSVLQLGPDALTWNHLDIALALGRRFPALADNALELGGHYEQARYAPASEAMSPTSVRTARDGILRMVEGTAA